MKAPKIKPISEARPPLYGLKNHKPHEKLYITIAFIPIHLHLVRFKQQWLVFNVKRRPILNMHRLLAYSEPKSNSLPFRERIKNTIKYSISDKSREGNYEKYFTKSALSESLKRKSM